MVVNESIVRELNLIFINSDIIHIAYIPYPQRSQSSCSLSSSFLAATSGLWNTLPTTVAPTNYNIQSIKNKGVWIAHWSTPTKCFLNVILDSFFFLSTIFFITHISTQINIFTSQLTCYSFYSWISEFPILLLSSFIFLLLPSELNEDPCSWSGTNV